MSTVRIGMWAARLAVLLASLAVPAVVVAHGAPSKLQYWGNFPRTLAGCQRAIGHAAITCSLSAIRARVECGLAETSGLQCDPTTAEQAIQLARAKARDLVERVCTVREVQNLRYNDVSEAQADVINMCRWADTAALTAVFNPFKRDSQIVAQSSEDLDCIEAAAVGVRKALRFSMHGIAHGLNRIASSGLDLPMKQAVIARSRMRAAQGVQAVTTLVDARCDAGQRFLALYGRSASDLLLSLMGQADCLGGQVYVQDAVVCPESVCGNGVQERDEDCDDGNMRSDDACAANCRSQ